MTPTAWLGEDEVDWSAFGPARTRRRERPRRARLRPWTALAVAVAAALSASWALAAGHRAHPHLPAVRRVAHRVTPLRRIARCESGGNPRAVSPDGRYRGRYQFDSRTWRTVGGRGDPASASPAVQDRLARRLLARRGAEPWPICGHRAG